MGPAKLSIQWVSGVRQREREADDSPPSNVYVKNGGAVPPLHHTRSVRRAKLIKRSDDFIFFTSAFSSATGRHTELKRMVAVLAESKSAPDASWMQHCLAGAVPRCANVVTISSYFLSVLMLSFAARIRLRRKLCGTHCEMLGRDSIALHQWYSTWDTRTPRDPKTSYGTPWTVNQLWSTHSRRFRPPIEVLACQKQAQSSH
jgi:hypothetical protein